MTIAMSHAECKPCELKVSNLDPAWTAGDVFPIFATLDGFRAVHLHRQADGTSRGWARVEFADREQAEAAWKARRGLVIEGRKIEVVVHERCGGVTCCGVCELIARPLAQDSTQAPPSQLNYPQPTVASAATTAPAAAAGDDSDTQPAPLLPPSLAELAQLPLTTIWSALDACGPPPASWVVPPPPPLSHELTEHWVASRSFDPEGLKQELELKVDGLLRAWGYRSARRTAAHQELEGEDPHALVYVLNCYPTVLKAWVEDRLSRQNGSSSHIE